MSDAHFMRLAIRLAQRGYGLTSPNPMVGAVLVKGGKVIGRGWHRQAGGPHAEIEALNNAAKHGHCPRGATLYVTLEPCSTRGRTPPCTEAIIAAGIKCVVVGAIDPNPRHAGKGFRILKRAGTVVRLFGVPRLHSPAKEKRMGRLRAELQTLNEAFNHWIVHRTPFVTVKTAMTLDGKIATASGESKWITSEKARAYGMRLRQGADAILVGINTILADNPSLTFRCPVSGVRCPEKRLRRIVLDSMARTPLTAEIVSGRHPALTTIVVSRRAPKPRLAALRKHVNMLVAPLAKSAIGDRQPAIDLRWLLRRLGAGNVTNLLIEGGGEVNASFLLSGLAQRVAFFYAPKILGGHDACKCVAGDGVEKLGEVIQLREVAWRRLGPDLLLTARVA